MDKYRLFAPGPTPVPDSVRLRMAEPVLHHRTASFETVFERVREGLRWVFQTRHDVLCLSGSGTAAMDGAVCNFLSRGDSAIFVNGGKFGERWGEILRAYGCEPIEIKVPWGQAVDPQSVAAALKQVPHCRAVFVQACETSTGVAHPVQDIAALCAQHNDVLCVVDGITAVGVSDVALDRDGIDVLISGSQKAFMLPPGLAFVGISEKAWRASKRCDLPKYYLNFSIEHAATQKNQSAWTSSVSLMGGLDEALNLMRAEGLANIFKRHAHMAELIRIGVQALGCTLYAQAPAHGVTAVCPPAGISGEAIVARLRDDYNLTVVGGQDQAKGKIVRLAHMGYFDRLDMLTMLAALEGGFEPARPPCTGWSRRWGRAAAASLQMIC